MLQGLIRIIQNKGARICHSVPYFVLICNRCTTNQLSQQQVLLNCITTFSAHIQNSFIRSTQHLTSKPYKVFSSLYTHHVNGGKTCTIRILAVNLQGSHTHIALKLTQSSSDDRLKKGRLKKGGSPYLQITMLTTVR